MHRNVWYNPRERTVRLWTWDENGKRVERTETFNPYIYIESNNYSDAVSMYDTPLRKMVFPNEFDRRRYIKEGGLTRIFYNIRPEQQFLIEKFSGMQNDPSFSQHPLKVFFLDIETYSPDKFPIPALAEDPINLITVHDSITKKYTTFGLKEDYVPKRKNVTYVKCSSETELLECFITFWQRDFPDVVSGWNSEGFDIPYIIKRVQNVLGEGFAQKLSPVNSIYYREAVQMKHGKQVGRWHIHGISCIDYLEAYKSFSRSMRESYKLDYIAHVELGHGKVTFNESSLATLSDRDWEKFTDYNLKDVEILVDLEEKLRFIKIMRMISYKGFTSMESAMGKIQVITGAIAEEALRSGKVLPTFVHPDMGTYKGGFVREIDPGLREDIITFDANSLYPNVLISLNLSLETKIGKIINVDEKRDEVEIKLVNGKTHMLSKDNLRAFIEKEDLALSRAKVLYSQKKKGIIPAYVDGLYSERVVNKNEMLRLQAANSGLDKRSHEYKENAKQIDNFDVMQYTLKILLNSIYGVFGNKYSPFYDLDHAASITNTGQAVIKAANRITEQYIKAEYDTDDDSYVYSDTDSTHITLRPLLEATNETLLLEDNSINPIIYDKAQEIQEVINNGMDDWALKTLNSKDSRFFFKREAICPVAIYQSKKHYILHMRDKGEADPIPCDYIKYVGVEVAKSTMSEEVKQIIRNVVETMVYEKDRTRTTEVYREGYEAFKLLPIENIAFRTGLSEYDKYDKARDGLAMGKRTPPHAKGALYYNILREEYNIERDYDPIKAGQKLKWVYTLPSNKYNMKCMAFIDHYPEEIMANVKPDYEKMFEKIVSPAIDRFYECVQWRTINFRNEYVCDLFDLLGE